MSVKQLETAMVRYLESLTKLSDAMLQLAIDTKTLLDDAGHFVTFGKEEQ